MSTLRSVSLLASVSLTLVLGACAPKDAPSESTTDRAAKTGSTSDAATSFSKSWKIVGSLDYGQTSAPVAYTHAPRYRAFKFGGSEGDVVDIWVRSNNGGDAVAWLLDNDFKQLATNDDADASTSDSHIHATLPANASITHYIVFRDYDLWDASFTVELEGKKKPVDFFSCNVDADCVAVPVAQCCANGYKAAVNKSEVDAYAHSVTCDPHPICPYFVINDTRLAECNAGTHQCEMVKPEDVRCGGFTTNPHSCAPGYVCNYTHVPDVPGTCAKTCGGIAGIPCDAGFTCVDNPNDSCDPAHGGADCGGICVVKTCVQTQLCMTTAHWDATACACVPNACVETQLCVKTAHWDSKACACVPN